MGHGAPMFPTWGPGLNKIFPVQCIQWKGKEMKGKDRTLFILV